MKINKKLFSFFTLIIFIFQTNSIVFANNSDNRIEKNIKTILNDNGIIADSIMWDDQTYDHLWTEKISLFDSINNFENIVNTNGYTAIEGKGKNAFNIIDKMIQLIISL